MADFPSITASTYRNGSSFLEQYRRVYEMAGLLRYATSAEEEIGILPTNILENYVAAVAGLEHNHRYKCIADGAINDGVDVYRANDGKVSASGTSKIGKAQSSAGADGDIVEVLFRIESGGGGGGGGGNFAQFTYDGTNELTLPASPSGVFIAGLDGQRVLRQGTLASGADYEVSGTTLTIHQANANLLNGDVLKMTYE